MGTDPRNGIVHTGFDPGHVLNDDMYSVKLQGEVWQAGVVQVDHGFTKWFKPQMKALD